MKRPYLFVILLVAGLLAFAFCVSPALSQVPGASISGRIQTNTASFPNDTFVELVDPANYSHEYSYYNTTPDSTGFFQFTNVTFGNYAVYAYAPYYSWGVSSPMNITDNSTYTASIILLAEPEYADFNPGTVAVSYNGVADINVTIYDHWGNVVPNWYITLDVTSGIQPSPSMGTTDKNGNFKATVPYQDNVGPTAITVWAKAANGSYYELQGGTLPTATPVPTATTLAPSPATNATNTSAGNTTTPSAIATATPPASATTTPTPTPAPGFELLAGIIAIGIAIAITKIK